MWVSMTQHRAHICHIYHKFYLWRKNVMWRNFGRFCHNLRGSMWRKIEHKKYIYVEKMRNMRSGMISSIRVIFRHRTQTLEFAFQPSQTSFRPINSWIHNPHINHHSETTLREITLWHHSEKSLKDITQRHHSEISFREITWLYGKGLSCSQRECVDDLGQVFNLVKQI